MKALHVVDGEPGELEPGECTESERPSWREAQVWDSLDPSTWPVMLTQDCERTAFKTPNKTPHISARPAAEAGSCSCSLVVQERLRLLEDALAAAAAERDAFRQICGEVVRFTSQWAGADAPGGRGVCGGGASSADAFHAADDRPEELHDAVIRGLQALLTVRSGNRGAHSPSHATDTSLEHVTAAQGGGTVASGGIAALGGTSALCGTAALGGTMALASPNAQASSATLGGSARGASAWLAPPSVLASPASLTSQASAVIAFTQGVDTDALACTAAAASAALASPPVLAALAARSGAAALRGCMVTVAAASALPQAPAPQAVARQCSWQSPIRRATAGGEGSPLGQRCNLRITALVQPAAELTEGLDAFEDVSLPTAAPMAAGAPTTASLPTAARPSFFHAAATTAATTAAATIAAAALTGPAAPTKTSLSCASRPSLSHATTAAATTAAAAATAVAPPTTASRPTAPRSTLSRATTSAAAASAYMPCDAVPLLPCGTSRGLGGAFGVASSASCAAGAGTTRGIRGICGIVATASAAAAASASVAAAAAAVAEGASSAEGVISGVSTAARAAPGVAPAAPWPRPYGSYGSAHVPVGCASAHAVGEAPRKQLRSSSSTPFLAASSLPVADLGRWSDHMVEPIFAPPPPVVPPVTVWQPLAQPSAAAVVPPASQRSPPPQPVRAISAPYLPASGPRPLHVLCTPLALEASASALATARSSARSPHARGASPTVSARSLSPRASSRRGMSVRRSWRPHTVWVLEREELHLPDFHLPA